MTCCGEPSPLCMRNSSRADFAVALSSLHMGHERPCEQMYTAKQSACSMWPQSKWRGASPGGMTIRLSAACGPSTMSEQHTAHVSMLSSRESLRFTSPCVASAPSIALYDSSESTVREAGTVPASGSAFTLEREAAVAAGGVASGALLPHLCTGAGTAAHWCVDCDGSGAEGIWAG
eukprot:scaffold30784_cov34-Tisochrysis_lutea.AAC.3